MSDTMTETQCAWCQNASAFHCDGCNREHCKSHLWKCGQCGYDKVCVMGKENCHKCGKILCVKCGRKAYKRERFVCDTCAG